MTGCDVYIHPHTVNNISSVNNMCLSINFFSSFKIFPKSSLHSFQFLTTEKRKKHDPNELFRLLIINNAHLTASSSQTKMAGYKAKSKSRAQKVMGDPDYLQPASVAENSRMNQYCAGKRKTEVKLIINLY